MIRNKRYVYGVDLEIPSHVHFGQEMLHRMMEYGEQPALIDAENHQTMTFSDLAQNTVNIALSLTRIGVGKGDVVRIFSEIRMEYIPTALGAICAGAAFSYSFSADPEIIKATRPKVMFISVKFFELYKKAFDSVGCIDKYIIYDKEIKDGGQNRDGHEYQDGCVCKDGGIWFHDFLTETANISEFIPTPVEGWKDYALIKFTSGTTGAPKCVPFTHYALLLDSHSRASKRFKGSSILITRDWCFSSGTTMTFSYLRQGVTCVFTRSRTEDVLLRAVEKYKIAILQAVPSLMLKLIKSTILDKFDVSSVQSILSSVTPLAKLQITAVKKRFPNLRDVYQLYGATEVGSMCDSLHAPLGTRDGSVGVISHGIVIKVVDIKTREVLGPNQRGEICMKSQKLTSGYLGASSAVRQFDSSGFYLTGDIGYYDTDGYFYIVDRIVNVIQWNDQTISPVEIESYLDSLDEVKEAGVSSVEGALAAAVVLQPGGTMTQEQVADYINSMAKTPLECDINFVQKILRTPSEKIDRVALKIMLKELANRK